MPTQQIRLTRNEDIDKVLSFFKDKYPLLSEAEIIKMSLSDTYKRQAQVKFNKRKEGLDYDDSEITDKEWQLFIANNPAFDWLKDEHDLYTEADLKKRYV